MNEYDIAQCTFFLFPKTFLNKIKQSKMKNLLFFCCLFSCFSCQSQKELTNYLGGWSGELQSLDDFRFDFILSEKEAYQLNIRGKETNVSYPLKVENQKANIEDENGQFTVKLDFSENVPIGFIQIGHHLCFLDFKSTASDEWTATWNLLLSNSFDPTFYLSLDQLNNNQFTASVFFQSPLCHYMNGEGFISEGNTISFRDRFSKLQFKGILQAESIALELQFLADKIKVKLVPTPYEQWKRGTNDEAFNNRRILVNKTGNHLETLLTDISNNTLEGVHSIIISKQNQTIFEGYFNGFSETTLHDTRSVAKSFAAGIVGGAIDDGYIENENELIASYYQTDYPKLDWSNGKDSISIQHLLTMSSGLDAIDFGLNRTSFANEGNFQAQSNWTEFILSAPMVFPPGTVSNYGSGSPHLLAPIIRKATKQELEFYIHKKLFAPLEITDYRIQVTNENMPYFGGGWYVNAKSLLNFGLLYLNKGKWKRKSVLSEDWVSKSMAKQHILSNAIDKNEYGYLFWHKSYFVNGKEVKSIESRGTGGQYLFIIPDFELVVVIMSGNYSNNKGFEPEMIMRDYILPTVLGE